MNNRVSFEIAKLLKEKGFDEPTNRYYEYALSSRKDPETNDFKGSFGWRKDETNLQSGYFKNNYDMADLSSKNWFMCSAPTIAEVIMWLYETHEIWISVDRHFDKFISKNNGVLITFYGNRKSYFDTPTEAYSSAIEYCLTKIELK